MNDVRSPAVKPRRIGTGKPGKIPLFSRIRKVTNAPITTPTKEAA
jgi:hypothetical protein